MSLQEVDDYYEKRAHELEKLVSKASACSQWMGSWMEVDVYIDPVGTTEFSDELKKEVSEYLNAVRIDEDRIIIKAPKYVPLEIHVPICVEPGYLEHEVGQLLEDEFSDGYTTDGREAFFNPDRWTFGQSVKLSQIIGRVQSIKGVSHVINNPSNPNNPDTINRVTIERWNATSEYDLNKELEIGSTEIIKVRNDPNQIEDGFIYFHLGN